MRDSKNWRIFIAIYRQHESLAPAIYWFPPPILNMEAQFQSPGLQLLDILETLFGVIILHIEPHPLCYVQYMKKPMHGKRAGHSTQNSIHGIKSHHSALQSIHGIRAINFTL